MTPPGAGEKGITPEPPQGPRKLHAVEPFEVEPALRTPERPSHNLPLEFSSFVGREKELSEVRRLLDNTRLLTLDRKSTRLNSSHANISYAVFCLKKKKKPSMR